MQPEQSRVDAPHVAAAGLHSDDWLKSPWQARVGDGAKGGGEIEIWNGAAVAAERDRVKFTVAGRYGTEGGMSLS